MAHRSGFVNIIGNPNVGKSTLMNALVGAKLAIVSPKAQTTRDRIQGILNGDDYQIIFSDTPGILDPKYKLQETMLKAAKSALIDADILIYVTDIQEPPGLQNKFYSSLVKTKIPLIIVVNKIDKSDQEKVERIMKEWAAIIPLAKIIPVSATEKFNLDSLLSFILEYLPEGPAFYPADDLTDKPERFFTGEIIREKLLQYYREEVPYSTAVEVESFKEDSRLIKIRAIIFVERDSQKGIIIGNKGEAIKRTGTAARLEMEKFFGKRIFLELFVKVKKDWRNNETMLKSFGYK